MPEHNTIASRPELVSDDINDIISRRPHWVVRHGNIIFLFLLIGGILAARFIHYPDIVSTQAVLLVSPADNKYYAQARIAQKDFQKINEGQEVLLKFYSYPYQEYGIVKGHVGSIDETPSASGYLAKIIFTNDLHTTHGKKIQYKEGLSASAEIITRNTNLLARFINDW